jgi:hypothetical protein
VSQPVHRAVRRGAAIPLLAASFAPSPPAPRRDRAIRGPRRLLHFGSACAHPTGNPVLCGRSTNSYPQDVKRAISPASFTDASCSSATTADMTRSQSLEGGLQTAPPQFNALGARDALVTVGIGGNDAGLIGVAEECATLDAVWRSAAAARAITGPGQRLRGDQDRRVPFSSGDVAYVDSLELQLNAVIKQAAQANGATYVDTFTSSIGHDAEGLRRVGQRNHPHLGGIPPSSQSGRRSQHGQASRR